LRTGDRLSVTLVGPEYPINVGYTARLVKNFGLSKLYLVAPRFDMKVATVYAAHGADVLERAEVVDLDELRKRHDLLVATTAVPATRRANVNRLSLPPEEIADYVSTSKSTSLVFGRDTTGLRNEELAKCDVVTTMTTGTRYKTLNVSHSVAILLYLLSKPRARKEHVPDPKLRGVFAKYAYELAIASGVQGYRADKLRRLAERISLRSHVNEEELTLLVFLLRRATVALSDDDQTRSKT
jgi:tRNA/rRNA methyltransferase